MEEYTNDIVEGYVQHNFRKKHSARIRIQLDEKLSAKSMNNERLIACSKEYCRVHGYLRVPDRYTMDIEYSDGTMVEYCLGNVIRKMRAAYKGKSLSRILSTNDDLRMREIDKDWKLSDFEYEQKIFMLSCEKFKKKYGHLRIEKDYMMKWKLPNGSIQDYPLGKIMDGVKKRTHGYKVGILVTSDMIKKLNQWDEEWAVSNHEFDIEFKNRLLLDCAREFYAEYGHLRVNRSVEMEIVDENGDVYAYDFGTDLANCRVFFNNGINGRKLPEEIIDEFNQMDPKWSLLESDYSRVRFMECAKTYFEQNGHLRPSTKDKVDIIYNNGVVEHYAFGVLLRRLRYECIHNASRMYITKEDIDIMNAMDPYWINREKTIDEMKFEKLKSEDNSQQIDEYFEQLYPVAR